MFAETITTEEGVVFTPESTDGGVGYKITSPGGAVEYVFLVPSTEHQYNEDNGAIADTFVYRVDMAGAAAWAEENAGPGTGVSLAGDLGEPVVYINHFEKEEAEEERWWTVAGLWMGANGAIPVAVMPGQHLVEGGQTQLIDDCDGPWATSVQAKTAEEAEAKAVAEMEDGQ